MALAREQEAAAEKAAHTKNSSPNVRKTHDLYKEEEEEEEEGESLFRDRV